jgi:hypothetical protein
MTFKDALSIVSESSFIKLMYPSWAMGFTPRLRKVRLAFTELEVRLLACDSVSF